MKRSRLFSPASPFTFLRLCGRDEGIPNGLLSQLPVSGGSYVTIQQQLAAPPPPPLPSSDIHFQFQQTP